jgi:hypothetical protein
MKGNYKMKWSEKLLCSSRRYFSISHIRSADELAKLSSEKEKDIINRPIGMIQSNVITSIIMSVAFLEANINEFFCDLHDKKKEFIKRDNRINNLDESIITRIKNMWKLEVPKTAKFNIIQKYNIALVLADKEEIDNNNSLYENIKTLIALRNSLTHYEPENIELFNSDEKVEIHKLGKNLKNKNFSLNPLLENSSNTFYPDKCLSSGCAKWACISSIEFVDNFSRRMNIIPHFDHIRNQLWVLK